ncbi:NAD-dependent protein deacylase [Anaerovorax odorimutans]|uniref:NAD-dependent protein deacetylase n=1 Tax=Anaerovorax odorimutans TaxID=109327 RepID=A0ABT1RSB3_9FIRM|nr:NAD-dependent protein deacylase [Anaerovorax odorimutans]MCQ4638107.1 NAD-dependent protein deacylase [Anaerovorax odorimutans]
MRNQEFIKIVEESDNIVFFGGAGVSTESGIPDFRSEEGIYKAWTEYGRPSEEIICRPFFDRKPEVFFEYYRKNLLYPEAKPNEAHRALARLERQGKVKAIITQNIDGLHQAAGSKNVIELHGSVLRNYCMKCHRSHSMEYVLEADGVPLCQSCGGIVKPDIVLYQEEVKRDVLDKAISAIKQAETLIVGGTSLVVYPAAGLVEHFQGKHLILINKSQTQYDEKADLVINQPIGEIFAGLLEF